MTTFVVPDAHGNHALVRSLLSKQGIIDVQGRRLPQGPFVVQLGDLCNCVATNRDDDVACLRVAPHWFDLLLVGNHEHGHITPHGAFAGFYADDEIGTMLRALYRDKRLLAAWEVDGILLTHAGLSSQWGRKFDDARAAAAHLNDLWWRQPDDPIFTTAGQARGGWAAQGGILWSDWAESKRMKFSQIVGHTPGEHVRRRHWDEASALCIDLGAGKGRARIAGAWIEDGYIRPVEYDAGTARGTG